MVLRPKPGSRSKAALAEFGAAASDPRAPSGTQGWKLAESTQGTTTLWRRRGRLTNPRVDLRQDQ